MSEDRLEKTASEVQATPPSQVKAQVLNLRDEINRGGDLQNEIRGRLDTVLNVGIDEAKPEKEKEPSQVIVEHANDLRCICESLSLQNNEWASILRRIEL